MQQDYGEHVVFRTIYIKEAHPTDEWQMDSNVEEDVCYVQPKDLAGRVAIANDFVKRHEYDIPLLIDDIDNLCDELYAGWPERLYVIDENGVIAYKGGTGPFNFEPEEVEAWLAARFPAKKPAPAAPVAASPASTQSS